MFFARTFFSVCLLSTSLFFLAVALLVRSLPAFVDLASHIVRFLLLWSYRLYRPIFGLLDPFTQIQLGIHPVDMPCRMILSVLLSVTLGCLFMRLLGKHITWIAIIVSGFHGITVAWLWTDFFEPQGLHIGKEE